MSQDDKKIHINLSADTHRKLRAKCAYEAISVQNYVEKLIEEDLARYEIIVQEKTPNNITS